MQVYRHCQGGYWRASKRWCKQLPLDAVSKALIRFANNEAGLCPACVYGGPTGAIEQLKCLERWFLVSSPRGLLGEVSSFSRVGWRLDHPVTSMWKEAGQEGSKVVRGGFS